MKTTCKDWLKVVVSLLDEAAAIALIFLVLHVLGIKVPLPITVVVALLLGVFVFITHKAIISSFHQKQVTGAEGLVGVDGEVVEPLAPSGVIQVQGEYWKAKSVGESIAVGEKVEVLGLEGLTLMVKPRKK